MSVIAIARTRGSHEAPAPARSRPGRRATPGRLAQNLVLVVFTVLAVYATAVPFLMQRSGVELVTLTSGSMEPLFPTGATLAIRDARDAAALEPGQVITFRSLGNGAVITHRIIDRVEDPALGQVHYQTQGDANESPDPDLAPASNVIGVVDGLLPRWQALAVSLQTPKGRLVVYGGLFLVIAFGEMSELLRPRRAQEDS